MALVGMALWGVGMGAQESIMRAAIAEMVPMDKRSTAYGIFNAGFGLFWFLGSALMGILYDVSVPCSHYILGCDAAWLYPLSFISESARLI